MMKPFIECSLNEILNSFVVILRTGNVFHTVDCTEDDSHYKLIITHSLGINSSKVLSRAYEKMFESCGIKVEKIISEKTIFMKIFKNK